MNMEKMEKIHALFGEVWGMFNGLRKTGYSDEGWKAAVAKADELGKNSRLLQEVVLAVIDEAEAEYKSSPEDRKTAYKTAAAVFSGSWKLFEDLMNCPAGEKFSAEGIRLLADYLGKYPKNTFAGKLGNSVYRAACSCKKGDGNFVAAALGFYMKYQNGIDEKCRNTAFAEAERILNVRPEYTLQMMELLNGLQKRAEEKSKAAA